MTTYRSLTLTISIERPWQEVYDFVIDPANMSQWAAGLGNGFDGEGLEWTARDPGGNPVRIRFVERNALGVFDHDVFVGDRVVHVPLRVMPNGTGAEVTFLLLQTPDLAKEEDFERDAAAVRKDLQTLKDVLERRN